uniref:Uncharacterized protein n=1 Tax=Glossina brevipalpis TaxID=37001 RepID=A0A1A9W5M5_9MUSC
MINFLLERLTTPKDHQYSASMTSHNKQLFCKFILLLHCMCTAIFASNLLLLLEYHLFNQKSLKYFQSITNQKLPDVVADIEAFNLVPPFCQRSRAKYDVVSSAISVRPQPITSILVPSYLILLFSAFCGKHIGLINSLKLILRSKLLTL